MSPTFERPLVQVINAERIVTLGWSRAVLAQLAHPLVATGVAEHSIFARDPRSALRRFRATVAAMRALTFGPPERAAAAAMRIRQVHDRVRGFLPYPAGRYAAGTPYSAHDPALLTWVHLTTVEATLEAYHRFVAPLDRAARDRYSREATALEHWLGLPHGTFPSTWTAIEDAIQRARLDGTLAITPAAQRLARQVIQPPHPVWQEPFAALWKLLALGLLPDWLRDLYGFPWSAEDARRFARLVRWIRTIWPRLPGALRQWPEARRASLLPRPPEHFPASQFAAGTAQGRE